uniref:Calmodulin n=1 Tax=Attheya septentrionalis TaxID=420275 RepID=A0A7S2UJ36_9STRA|mmetsp:Transcript_25641/g.46424  ORF Transcript_25641/g.46424 Transcript_25641/m.46424 type:complete len:500 (+) Transcript_25641:436-1935(+)
MGACLSKKGKLQKQTSRLNDNLVQDDNRKVTDVYTTTKELGKGQASNIVQVRGKNYVKSTHGNFAMKLYDGKAKFPPDLKTEAEILKRCNHPNIIRLFELAKTGKKNKQLSLVMELCTGGSVLDRMPYKDEKQVVKILHQLISAVCYLHQQQHVAHRDIEPSNILYETEDEDSDIKLIDFGCATLLEPTERGGYKFLTEKTGTLHIMAPEVLKGKYSPQADMWSVGVVAYTLFQDGKKPFDGPTIEKVEQQISMASLNYPSWHRSKEAKAFVKQLLCKDPRARLTASKALHHPFMAQGRPKIKLSNELVVSFQMYARGSPLKRIALNALVLKSAVTVRKEYRQLFRNLDMDQKGSLTKLEFKTGFKNSGFSDEELEDLFTKLDVNNNKEIMYTEFLAATLEVSGELEEAQIKEAFEILDEDASGAISKKNLIKLLGGEAEDQKAAEIMLEGQNEMKYEEFAQLFEQNFSFRGMDTIQEMSLTAEQLSFERTKAGDDGGW